MAFPERMKMLCNYVNHFSELGEQPLHGCYSQLIFRKAFYSTIPTFPELVVPRLACKTPDHYLSIFGDGIASFNLQSETATINSIVADLKDKPELLAAVAVLSLDSWITELDPTRLLAANTSAVCPNQVPHRPIPLK